MVIGDPASSLAHTLPGTLTLAAEVVWRVSGAREHVDQLCARLPTRVVDRWGDHARLRFGNTVGTFNLGALGRLEVVNGKWDQSAFDVLLNELTVRAAALPFAAGAGAALPYERTVLDEPDLAWHAFVYLRHVLSDAAPPREHLPSALAMIVADPHRSWQVTDEVVPVAEATDIDASVLIDLVTGCHPTVPVAEGRFVLGDRLGGRMPTEVRARRQQETFDTPENRFVLDLLHRCLRLLDHVEAMGRTGGLAAEVAVLRDRLAPVLSAGLWRSVGRMTLVPVASTVLHGRRGYREVFRVAERLRLASRVPLDASALHDLLENRDIAALYEMWVYFAVVDAVAAHLGPPQRADAFPRTDTQITVPWRYRVRWAGGVTVTYNPTFSTGAGVRQSWSVPLRPDVLLSVPTETGEALHVLDAKFKVRWLESAGDAEDMEDRGVFLRGDIYKMHTYRDALQVRSAWVVYPGTVHQSWSLGPEDSVGAVPAVPGATDVLASRIGVLLETGSRSPTSSPSAPSDRSPSPACPPPSPCPS